MAQLVTLEGARRPEKFSARLRRLLSTNASQATGSNPFKPDPARVAHFKRLETIRRARLARRYSFLSADQNPELGSFLSRTLRRTKKIARKAKNVGLKISRIALGPIDAIIAKFLETKIKEDGNVIKPGLRPWAISNSSRALAMMGPQAIAAKPIFPKLIDRAIARLKKKYPSGSDSSIFPAIDKKILIGGGVALLLLVYVATRKKERVEIRTQV